MKKQGFTLAEVLIGATLAFVVGGVILNFVLSLFSSSSRASARDGLQSRGTILLGRMSLDLSSASLPSLELRDHGMVFTRLLTITTTGQRVWEEKSLAYFWEESTNQLWYRECPPIPASTTFEFSPSRPPNFSKSDLDQLLVPEPDVTSSLAKGVTNFQLSKEGRLIHVTLGLEAPAAKNRIERFELTKSVELKN